jgi:hypothetical protein
MGFRSRWYSLSATQAWGGGNIVFRVSVKKCLSPTSGLHGQVHPKSGAFALTTVNFYPALHIINDPFDDIEAYAGTLYMGMHAGKHLKELFLITPSGVCLQPYLTRSPYEGYTVS